MVSLHSQIIILINIVIIIIMIIIAVTLNVESVCNKREASVSVEQKILLKLRTLVGW